MLILFDRILGICKGYVLLRLGWEMIILFLWKKIENKKDSGWNVFEVVYFLRESLIYLWNYLWR